MDSNPRPLTTLQVSWIAWWVLKVLDESLRPGFICASIIGKTRPDAPLEGADLILGRRILAHRELPSYHKPGNAWYFEKFWRALHRTLETLDRRDHITLVWKDGQCRSITKLADLKVK